MADMKRLLDDAMRNKDKDYKSYNDVQSRLYDCINTYENVGYENNKHNLILSNGDVINFRMSRNHISHLLGVNIDFIGNSNRMDPRAKTNYEKLKYFIENEFDFKSFVDPNKKIEENEMFSPYIFDKLRIFLDNIEFRSDDIEFIVKYDPERVYFSEEKGIICDYYIVRKFGNDIPYYGVIGLVDDENSPFPNNYVPQTSQIYYNEGELDEFFKRIAKKQEIVYPVIYNITNDKNGYQNKFITFDEVKEKYITKIRDKSKKYDCTPAVINDLYYTLSRECDYKKEKDNILEVLRLLSSSIKSGSILDNDTVAAATNNIELSETVTELISLNNTLINNIDSKGQVNNNYFEVSEENKKLREELGQSSDDKIELEKRIEELEKENADKDEKLDEFKHACQKVFKKKL